MTRAFTEKELREAARAAMARKLAEIPAEDEIEFAFSEAFREKMDALTQKVHIRQRRSIVLRRIAAVITAALIGTAAFVAVNPDARAAFVKWVREVYENCVVYKNVEEPEISAELPEYELTWVPEGMVEVDRRKIGEGMYSVYSDKTTEKVIFFEYCSLDDRSHVQLNYVNTASNTECFEINGYSATFYPITSEVKTNILIWKNDNANLMFALNGNLDKEIMIAIAESIKIRESNQQ